MSVFACSNIREQPLSMRQAATTEAARPGVGWGRCVFTPKKIWASSALFSLQEKSLHAGYALFGIDFMVQISPVKVYVPNSRSCVQIMMEKVKQTSMRCLSIVATLHQPREL